MALGVLGLIFMGLLVLSIMSIVLTLFAKNEKVLTGGFIATLALTALAVWFSESSLPINYMTQKVIALTPGIPAFLAILLWFKGMKHQSKIIACIALVMSLFFVLFL